MTAPGSQLLTNIQVAAETGALGTAVARTRKFYGISTGTFDPGYQWQSHAAENRGSKIRSPRSTLIQQEPKITLSDIDGIAYDDLVLPLSMGLQGGLTGVGGAADKVWSFAPVTTAVSNAYESACMDFGDDIQNYTVAGLICTGWTLSAEVGGPTKFSADLIGMTTVKGAATALSNITPEYMSGELWTIAHAANWAGLAAASAAGTFLKSFSLKYVPGVLPVHYLDGSLAFGQIVEGEISGTLDLEFDSTALAVSAYYDKNVAQTPVWIKLSNVGAALGGTNYGLVIYLYGYVTDVKPISGESDGINHYTATVALDYDSVGAHHLTATLTCSLAAIP
jgi:hypothetical protein